MLTKMIGHDDIVPESDEEYNVLAEHGYRDAEHADGTAEPSNATEYRWSVFTYGC